MPHPLKAKVAEITGIDLNNTVQEAVTFCHRKGWNAAGLGLGRFAGTLAQSFGEVAQPR
jgi:hypothetical protein